MQTKQIYYDDPYQKELDATVLSVEQSGSYLNVILDQTIFYPEGGGQPSDKGTLGEAKVEYVRVVDGEIIHQVKGTIEKGQQVHGVIDWDWRHRYMRIHTAGHVLHDVLMTMVDGLSPLKGSHGKKPFVEYQGEFDASRKEELETKINEAVQKDLPVVTKFVTIEEMEKECTFIPPNLPRNKPLRMIKIGDFPGMPDGGVQVKSTKEIGKIWIANITVAEGKTSIRYGIANE